MAGKLGFFQWKDKIRAAKLNKVFFSVNFAFNQGN